MKVEKVNKINVEKIKELKLKTMNSKDERQKGKTTYIYIDESGDLGTKKASSKYFVMAAIKVVNSKKLENIIKKTRRDFKKKMLTSNEVKGGNLPYELKIKILEKLKNHYISLIVDKNYLMMC